MAAPAWVGMSSVIETTGAGDRTESIEITASDLPSGCPADARLFLLIDQYSWGASASHTSPAAPWESWWDGSIGVPVGPNTREFEVWTCRRVDAALPVSIEFTWPAGTSGGANLFAEGIGRLRIAAWERSVLIGADATTNTGGNGGSGTASSISGSSVTYSGGGGGSGRNTGGTGGGAGGNGARWVTTAVASTAGTTNRGGGGGGGYGVSGTGAAAAAGGSGIVIVRYLTAG